LDSNIRQQQSRLRQRFHCAPLAASNCRANWDPLDGSGSMILVERFRLAALPPKIPPNLPQSPLPRSLNGSRLIFTLLLLLPASGQQCDNWQNIELLSRPHAARQKNRIAKPRHARARDFVSEERRERKSAQRATSSRAWGISRLDAGRTCPDSTVQMAAV